MKSTLSVKIFARIFFHELKIIALFTMIYLFRIKAFQIFREHLKKSGKFESEQGY